MINGEQARRAQEALRVFLETPLEQALGGAIAPQDERLVAHVRSVAATVPAYRSFLGEHGVDPASVQTLDDVRALPLTSKESYLRRYPLPELCRDGRLEQCDMIAVSSGSTGQPTFWPRFLSDELQIATRFEQVFHDSFAAQDRRTLAVVCFPLGTWVGGMYTASCCRHLAAKGYPLTVITPGNNKEEIFRVVRELAPLFEQTVLLGYPPFVKGIVDEGLARGLEWSRYGVKLVLAGEVFSEEWRALVGERTGSTSPYDDSASLYGTADAGVLGVETPLSICIRRFFARTPAAAQQLFGESRLPTLVQYDPASRFFETVDGTLLFSGDNGIPLVRYHIADSGGILSLDGLLEYLAEWGYDPLDELGPRVVRRMPFVYVFGRSHFTISYYGANIYPENVTVALEQPPISGWATGKFVLETREDADKNRYLAVVVELAPGVAPDEAKAQAIAEAVVAQLLRLNSEFANYVPPEQRLPRVELRPLGDPEYFPLGVKHRYTRKSE